MSRCPRATHRAQVQPSIRSDADMPVVRPLRPLRGQQRPSYRQDVARAWIDKADPEPRHRGLHQVKRNTAEHWGDESPGECSADFSTAGALSGCSSVGMGSGEERPPTPHLKHSLRGSRPYKGFRGINRAVKLPYLFHDPLTDEASSPVHREANQT